MHYFGKRVNYNLNGIVIIRNKEVNYEIYCDGLPRCIMQFQGLKEVGRRVA